MKTEKKIWRLIKQKREHETKMGKKEHRSGTEKNEKEKKLYWRNELYNSMDTERLDKKIKGDKREKKGTFREGKRLTSGGDKKKRGKKRVTGKRMLA